MGRVLGGRYAIERRIGEGGMAEVLLARDRARHGAPVVVKRCRAHLAHQPEFAELFLREARLASLIHHPNVVELEATGDDDGQPYLVMEYLEGFTVREIFTRAQIEGGVPQDLAALVILGAARGLHAAHTAVDEQGVPMGLMHRDVSPHNLFINDHGVVKVLDFGIAKGVNEHTMTRAGHVKGKASYLAPEQLDPDAKVDARADLFSLGTVAWELFTGRRLFRKSTETETIHAIRALKVDRPDKVRPEIDAEYADVVMWLLRRHPEQRPSSADEVARSIERALARRAPRISGSALAEYVAHVKEIDPNEVSRVSFLPGEADPASQQKRKDLARAFQKARGQPPKPPEESTATVAPPVASWVSEAGPAPVDGSVVGTFAIAGATSAQADLSGGYGALDPDDLVLEPSHSEADALLAPPSSERAERPIPAPLPSPPAPAPVPTPRSVAPPPRLGPTLTETVRVRPPPAWERYAERMGRAMAPLVTIVEARIGKQPNRVTIASILLGALFTGMTLAFVVTKMLR